jgi:hypothetical protein
MAILSTGDITLPKNIAAGLWEKAQTGSTVAQLSGSEPMQFGEVDVMTFTRRPKAEYVGEGVQKSPTEVAFGVKTITPKKVQVTLRFNEEVQWADEDYQLGVLTTCANASGDALARALDLGVFHRINPLTGEPIGSVDEWLNQTENRVEIGSVTPPSGGGDGTDLEFEAAAGLVIDENFVPNAVAFDTKHAWTLATARYTDGRKKYPELGLGTNISSFEGLTAARSTTVSAREEAEDTGVRAFLGDFKEIRWGVQRRVPVEMIRYGDPDGQGDLKRQNQIALRTEVVYGWAIMDLDAFAVLEVAAA